MAIMSHALGVVEAHVYHLSFERNEDCNGYSLEVRDWN